MFGKKPRSHTLYDAEVLLQRRKDVQQHEYNSRYKRIRLSVYQFLDHPLTANSTLYHFLVFFVVLLAVILGATTETLENHWMIDVYSRMESVLLVFFVVEFFIRLWSIEADAKYMGWKGKWKYMRSIVCIADIIIIIVTFIMRVVEKRYVSKNTMDYLRFIQILRLFHIDRQMTTWRLIKNMIMISKMELFSAYYITFFIFLVLANAVYILENSDFHQISSIPSNGTTDTITAVTTTMPSLADAWWFSAVTILTIGYGDIVPAYWTTKLIVCLLGFLAFCTFVTASTQISVGLTLMMEEDNKMEYKNKLRNTSASVIQCWYRYHLATRLVKDKNFIKTQHFKHVCYKLYLTNERLQRIQDEEKKRQQRLAKKRKSSSAIRVHSIAAPLNEDQNAWIQSLRYKVAPQVINTAGILDSVVPQQPLPPPPQHKSSTVHVFKRFMSLPFTSSVDADDLPPTIMDEKTRPFQQQRTSTDTAISSSFDSDTEHNYDLLRQQQYNSADINEVDDRILARYQPLLRFINFLLFHEYVKKFQRFRKADKMLQMEAEITERDHERDEKFRELEDSIGDFLGKPSRSHLSQDEEKLTVTERVNLFEQRLADMENKLQTIESLSEAIMKCMKNNSLINSPSVPATPTLLPVTPATISTSRTPSTTSLSAPLSRRGSRLQRQATIDLAVTTLHEYAEDDDSIV